MSRRNWSRGGVGLFRPFVMDKARDCQLFGVRFSEGFGLRGMLAPCLGRPRLSFGREGFAQVQVLKARSVSVLPEPSGVPACALHAERRQAGKPLRETPPPCDHLPLARAHGPVRPLFVIFASFP